MSPTVKSSVCVQVCTAAALGCPTRESVWYQYLGLSLLSLSHTCNSFVQTVSRQGVCVCVALLVWFLAVTRVVPVAPFRLCFLSFHSVSFI